MNPACNATHDPARRSWIESANAEDTDFPIQNLPFGRFRRDGGSPRAGIAIGDQILDLGVVLDLGLLRDAAALEAAGAAVAAPDLTALLALGNGPASALRHAVSDLLDRDNARRAAADAGRLLIAQDAVEMLLPLAVRQFSDMCASTFHIGRRRGVDDHGEPLCPPVFRTLPVGYDGRASSVVVSGTPVRRPNGSWLRDPAVDTAPCFGPEPRQDYELELGIWIGGAGNRLGEPIALHAAGDAIFGYCLLNDWSARGIQFWETMLGPFLGKSLATTVSPWIVTAEALAPFRTPAFARPPSDPAVPAHLDDEQDQRTGGIDLTMTAAVRSAAMTAAGHAAATVCVTNFAHMYWTPAQMVAHHASNGCALAAGDLLGSGTCSGPELSAAACLVEKLTAGPWTLPDGEPRTWLEDGDTVVLRARATRDGSVPIGFGEATGTILPAPDWPTA